MNGDLLQSLLSDESVARTLLAALPKQNEAANDADTDRTTLLYALAAKLPPREKALAERMLLMLLLVSLFARQKGE